MKIYKGDPENNEVGAKIQETFYEIKPDWKVQRFCNIYLSRDDYGAF